MDKRVCFNRDLSFFDSEADFSEFMAQYSRIPTFQHSSVLRVIFRLIKDCEPVWFRMVRVQVYGGIERWRKR